MTEPTDIGDAIAEYLRLLAWILVAAAAISTIVVFSIFYVRLPFIVENGQWKQDPVEAPDLPAQCNAYEYGLRQFYRPTWHGRI